MFEAEFLKLTELVQQKHLPIPTPDDGPILCLCDLHLNFVGPIAHRQHVSERLLDAMRRKGWRLFPPDELRPKEPVVPLHEPDCGVVASAPCDCVYAEQSPMTITIMKEGNSERRKP